MNDLEILLTDEINVAVSEDDFIIDSRRSEFYQPVIISLNQ